jgi:outer membrane lipoprotein-sorting protein
MKYFLIAIALCLSACDKAPEQKIAAPQRDALKKAEGVDQTVQQNTEAMKKKAEDAEK